MCRLCPIALALKDAGLIEPAVWRQTCIDSGTGKRYQLPQEAVDFIYAFDCVLPVAPISFEIREVAQA